MKNLIKEKRIGCDIKDLTPYEWRTCQILENAKRPLTTNEIAEYGNMSWLTAKRHLEALRKRKIGISSQKKGRAKLWFIK